MFYIPNNHKITSTSSSFSYSSLPFISFNVRYKKKSLGGNFYFIFYFMKMALLNGDDDYHSKRHNISLSLFMTEYIKKIMKSQHSHHHQPTFLSFRKQQHTQKKNDDCLYPLMFEPQLTWSSFIKMNFIYTRGPTFHSVYLYVFGAHKMVIKKYKIAT